MFHRVHTKLLFILLNLGKLNRIANDANNCGPSVNALQTANVVAISFFVLTHVTIFILHFFIFHESMEFILIHTDGIK